MSETGSATQDDAVERYIVDTTTASMTAMSGMQLVHDLREQIGYAVVAGSADGIPDGASYTVDLQFALDVPRAERPGMESAETSDPLLGLQWDKQSQRIERVHQTATGAGTRIGVIDDGVLGANPDSDATHPDLPNVRADLSANFTPDRQGPGALGDDHGTHVAGTAAAAANGAGVVGVAPDAELVDLRVFSGELANTGDVLAAIVAGSASRSTEFTIRRPTNEPRGYQEPAEDTVSGAACDVLNLSLSTPPLVPVAVEDPTELPELPEPYLSFPQSSLTTLVEAYTSAGEFAAEQGTVLVASAGNDGVNLDRPVELPSGESQQPTLLPAEADGYLSVAATGPIGYGWPADEFVRLVGGEPFEVPVETQLPEVEPAFYTNRGREAVDVSAGGGNADLDAAEAGVPGFFYDLVLATGFDPQYETSDPDAPANGGDGDGETEDERPASFVPTYTYKAGTSFAAPNVAGLAALLTEVFPETSAETATERIRASARPLPIGRGGTTTAPGAAPNEADDGDFDGDAVSGSLTERLPPAVYRGSGHVDVPSAVETFLTRFGDE